MRRHWTTSDIKGGVEFNKTDLWDKWRASVRKLFYNETNWISSKTGASLTTDVVKSKEEAGLGKIPFMATTGKIGVIVVDISKSSTTGLKPIRLKVYDGSTDALLASTIVASAVSSTSKKLSREFAGNKQYLSYSYSVIAFTPSTTYINSDGFPISKKVNISIEVNTSGSTWLPLDFVGYKTYLKLFEIGPGALTGGVILPYYNEIIPSNFFSAFYDLVKGDLYDTSVGQRYLNYIKPGSFVDELSGVNISFKKGSVLYDILDINNALSYAIGSDYYTTSRILRPLSSSYVQKGISLQYEVDGDPKYTDCEKAINTNLSHFQEHKWVGDFSYSNFFENDGLVKLNSFSCTGSQNSALTIASSSMLPGFEETKTNTPFEFAVTAGTQAHKQPVDNISMSIIRNTFKLPFWSRSVIDDVIYFDGKTFEGISETSDGIARYFYKVEANQKYFMMVLETFNTGTCDIVEATAGLYVKFYV